MSEKVVDEIQAGQIQDAVEALTEAGEAIEEAKEALEGAENPECSEKSEKAKKEKEYVSPEEKKIHQSEGTKKSWEDPGVAAARKIRRGCIVTPPDGVGTVLRFASVWAAFQYYASENQINLGNVSKAISFRRELRMEDGKEMALEVEGVGSFMFKDCPIPVIEKPKKEKAVKPKEGEEGFVPAEKKAKKPKKAKQTPEKPNEIPVDAEPMNVEAKWD
jgi:hypothetical protein